MEEEKKKAKRRGHNEGSIRKRADGYFEARVTCGYDIKTGKPIRKSFYSKNRGIVKAKMEAALDELRKYGILSQAQTFTVGEWLNHWLITYKLDTKPSTVQNLKNVIENYLKPLHPIKLDKLRPNQVQQVYNSIDTTNSTRMVEATHSCLVNAYKYAIKLGYVNFNPAQNTFLPKRVSTPTKALDRKQQEKFLNALEGNPNKNLLLFYLMTGLRRGELLALKWEDIDLENSMISVNRGAVREKDFVTGKVSYKASDTKTTSSVRRIPIIDDLKPILNELKNDNNGEYVFTNKNGGMLHLKEPNIIFTAIRKEIGLTEKGFTLHSLRDTFSTRVAEAGIMDKANQALLGHSSDATTKKYYIHANDDFLKEEVKKINFIPPNIPQNKSD